MCDLLSVDYITMLSDDFNTLTTTFFHDCLTNGDYFAIGVNCLLSKSLEFIESELPFIALNVCIQRH